jgi:hypothetical protein
MARQEAEGRPLPKMLQVLREAGAAGFYRDEGTEFLGLDGARHPVPQATTGRKRSVITGNRLIEQRQVDFVTHLAIAQIAGVKAVAAIIYRLHLGRTLGIA